jgi:hypothetical protein
MPARRLSWPCGPGRPGSYTRVRCSQFEPSRIEWRKEASGQLRRRRTSARIIARNTLATVSRSTPSGVARLPANGRERQHAFHGERIQDQQRGDRARSPLPTCGWYRLRSSARARTVALCRRTKCPDRWRRPGHCASGIRGRSGIRDVCTISQGLTGIFA